jgi:sulfoxide reductase catalytic subunit YedY
VPKLPSEPERDVTPFELYQKRRAFLKNAGLFAAVGTAWGAGLVALSAPGRAGPPEPPPKPPSQWKIVPNTAYDVSDERTPYGDVTTYNNFYELGLSKSAPAEYAGSLRPRPWTVVLEGEIAKPRTIDIDQLIALFDLEERIYRMRCVEAWSMVIPWLGFPLATLIERLEPTSRAKFVEFTTLLDKEQLPGQERPILPWPYVEALRIDEAMNPLTLLAVGLYGAPLPGQNGAPLRLVVPWKYGFKGGKSLVKIRFTEAQPTTTWNSFAPREYGFYGNVNPKVDHPRWTQANERRIGELGRRDTLMFNGYGEWVAGLYSALDLAVNY